MVLDDLRDLYRHNAWANAKVFGLAAALGDRLVGAEAPGTQGTVHATLAHLARVERGYLALIERGRLEGVEPREAYLAHDLAWFVEEVHDLGAGYVSAMEASTSDSLGRDLSIPWFAFPVSARDGLLQVLTHSAQHRSQVLSWLASQGVETPDLDYVVMLGELRSTS
jgi:uncharacterized damage-inducible protein DinB